MNARRTHSRWSLESGLDHAEALETQLDALLEKLEPRKAQIQRVQAQFSAQIGIAQYFDEVNPGFRLAPEVLRRLAELGLVIDFDQYCLGERGSS